MRHGNIEAKQEKPIIAATDEVASADMATRDSDESGQEAQFQSEQRLKTLRGIGLRMGLRMRMMGKEAFQSEFMQHDTDHNGLINAEEFKTYQESAEGKLAAAAAEQRKLREQIIRGQSEAEGTMLRIND